jgi:peroxiredoxin Q/BCP
MSLAPDFELSDTEGRTHRLADYAGQWLLLVFHRHLG